MASKILHTTCPTEKTTVTIRIDYSEVSWAGSNETAVVKDGYACEHMMAGLCDSSLSENFECPVFAKYTP